MTGGQSFLLASGDVLIDGPLLGPVLVGLDLYIREKRRSSEIRPEVIALQEKCRQAQADFAVRRQRSASGRAARTTADEAALWRRRPEEELLTSEQVGLELGYSASYLRRLMRKHGILPARKAGNSFLWTRAAVALLKTRMETS